MKRIAFVLAILMAFSTFVMAGGQGAQGQAAQGGIVEIRAAYWGDTRRFDLYDNIIREFERLNPNVRVIREPSSFNDYFDRLPVQVAGGNAPDFMSMHPRFSADYIPRGAMENLDPFVANGTISLDGWSQTAIDTGKWEGRLYMMAMGITFSSGFINLGVFEELGVTPPAHNWSWDDARRIGIQVREAFDRQGRHDSFMLTDLSNDISFNNFRYFLRQRGREQYNADGTIGFTVQDLEDWFTMMQEFRQLGIIPDAATSTEFFGAVLENSLFARDRVLIQWVPVNQFWLYNTTFPNKRMGAIRQAGSAGNSHVGEFPEGAHYGIAARSSNERKHAAAQLINFWLNDDRSLVLYQLDQGVPANETVVQRAVIPILDSHQTVAVNFVNDLLRLSTPSPNPPAGSTEVALEHMNAAQQVAFGARTPAQAAREFYALAQQIIARNR